MLHYSKFSIDLVKSFVIICLLSSATYAQDTEDDHIKLTIDSLLKEAWSFGRTNPLQSVDILKNIDQLNAKLDATHKEDVVQYYYAVFYKNMSRYDLSEDYFNRYEEFQLAQNDTSRLAAVSMAKSNLYSDWGKYPQSLEASGIALKYYEALKDTIGMISSGSKMGHMLTELGNHKEALKYLNKSLELSTLTGNIAEEVISNTNLGILYEKMKDYDTAIQFYSRAYELGESQDNAYSKVINRYNMASILIIAGQSEASRPFAEACARLADSINIPSLRGASHRLLANALVDDKQIDRALGLLIPQLDTTQYALGLKDQTEVYTLIVKAYKMQGNYSQAFFALETLKNLNDSLIGIESRKTMNELSAQYESEKKEQQIALLDLEKESALATIAQKNRALIIIGAGLVIVMGLSLFLYFLFTKYKEQKLKLTRLLEEKEYLIKEIHHRVKNNLQIISSLLQLQSRHLDEPHAIEALNDGESRVKSMAIIHQHLYTEDNLNQVNITSYIDNLITNLKSSYQSPDVEVLFHQDIEDIALDVGDMIPIGLIVNELITNSLKYAFNDRDKGNIWISIKPEQSGLKIEIKDDGVGMNPKQVSKGFGTRLIKAFIRKLDATMDIVIKDGTTVKITVPEYNKSSLRKISA